MAARVDDQNHSLSQLLEGQLLVWFLLTGPQTGRISCGLLLCWFLTQGTITQHQRVRLVISLDRWSFEGFKLSVIS